MENIEFLNVVKKSFVKFLETNSRSNKKLEILHGAIATDLAMRLGDGFTISSLGFGAGKEDKIQGRYINKNVDITILKDDKVIAGIGVKFVMQNYAQNSNNYFENMLGETANIQSGGIPYYQIFIIPDKLPYYNNKKEIIKWEFFNENQAKKYLLLSQDSYLSLQHVPIKTLLFIVNLEGVDENVNNRDEYKSYYLTQDFAIETSDVLSTLSFENSVVLNDYSGFMKKVCNYILSV